MLRARDVRTCTHSGEACAGESYAALVRAGTRWYALVRAGTLRYAWRATHGAARSGSEMPSGRAVVARSECE
eukprot:7194949-Pyramimonas_sp.AAC.1